MAMGSSSLTSFLSSSSSLLPSTAPNLQHTLFSIPPNITSLRRSTPPPHVWSTQWPNLLPDNPRKAGQKIAHPTFLTFRVREHFIHKRTLLLTSIISLQAGKICVPWKNSQQPKRKRTNSATACDTLVANVSSRHVVVTGGNSGIGKATATALAKQGMSITIACRSKAKGDIAVAEISQFTGNPSIRNNWICSKEKKTTSLRRFTRTFQIDIKFLNFFSKLPCILFLL